MQVASHAYSAGARLFQRSAENLRITAESAERLTLLRQEVQSERWRARLLE